MFRIDRNYVNLGAARFLQVDSGEGTEAGANGEAQYAAASANYMTEQQAMAHAQAQELLNNARLQADEIIEAARGEAALFLEEAREEALEERERARQEGYDEGAQEGKLFYEEQLTKKIREDDDMLKSVINEIYDERERTYSGLEDEVVGLSLEIVRKVINPADDSFGDIFESMMKNAIKQIAPDGKVVLRVSAAEYERFFSSGSVIIELDSGVTVKASVLRDVSLSGGDLIIDTETETVNAGLNSQLKYIALAFEKMVTPSS